MFEFVTGRLHSITPSKAVVNVQGIGYRLEIPLSVYTESLKIGSNITFYTAHIVREDSQRLFGFLTVEERDFFLQISDVSGIGPKTALSLVGHMHIDDLRDAIQVGNTKLLSKVPGIGKKTAERLVVELKDKVATLEKGVTINLRSASSAHPDFFTDATSALLNLGYNLQVAQKAVKEAMIESTNDLSEVITRALKSV